MDWKTVFTLVVIGMGFSWPAVGRYCGAAGVWVSVVVSAGTATVIALLNSRNIHITDLPPPKVLKFLLLAALMNGTGGYFYMRQVAAHTIKVSTLIITVPVITLVFISLLEWWLLSTTPTTRQVWGYAIAILALYLLVTGKPAPN